MPEIFETNDLHLVPRLPFVQVVDHFLAGSKPDQVDIKFIADRADEADQILVLLLRPVLVTLSVDEPRNF